MAEDAETAQKGIFTRPFLILWAFYFLVFAAGYQLFPVVPLHLRDLGASLAESGRFQTAFMLGSGIGSLFTGPLGDRLGPRRVLRLSSLLLVLILAAYALLRVRWGFYLLAPVHGVLWSALRTASVAKVGSILTPEHRAQGMSLFGLSGPGGVALGPLAGLWLLPHLGFAWMLAILALVFAVLHLLIGSLPREVRETGPRQPFALPDRSIWAPVALLFLLGLGFGPMPPYSAQEAKSLGMAWPSAFLTCFALGMVGIRALLSLTGMGRRPVALLPLMLGVTTLGSALLAFLPGGAARHLTAGLVYGGGYGMVHTLLFMHIIDTCPADRRGAGVGALFFAFDVGTALGALGLGWGMELTSFRWGWAAGGFLLALAMPAARRIARESRTMTTAAGASAILEA